MQLAITAFLSNVGALTALAQTIALCFGALGPGSYGALIGNGDSLTRLCHGYLLGAAVMVTGGIVALVYGVAAERRSLEDVAIPLSATGGGRTGSTRAEGAASPRSTMIVKSDT